MKVLFAMLVFACVSTQAAEQFVAPEKLEIWYGQVPDLRLKAFCDEVWARLMAWHKAEKKAGRTAPSRVQIVFVGRSLVLGSDRDILVRIACEPACGGERLFLVNMEDVQGSVAYTKLLISLGTGAHGLSVPRASK